MLNQYSTCDRPCLKESMWYSAKSGNFENSDGDDE